MGQSSALKSTFFVVWSIMVAAVIFALYHQDRFFAVDNKAIATIESKTGSVLVRSEGLVRWHETGEHDGVVDGDHVATGRSATTKITFGPGRAIVLGEDSQVQITAIETASKEYAYLIKLVRGTIVAEVEKKCQGCPPLVIRAGSETYNLAAGNRVGLTKVAGAKVKKFEPKGMLPEARPTPPPVVAVTQNFLAQKTPEPTPAPTPPPPKVKAAGYEAEVRPPTAGLTYWTLYPLSALSAYAIDVPVTPPADRPKRGDWRPVIEVGPNPPVAGKGEVIAAGPTESTIKVPIMKLRGMASINMHGGLKEYSFSLRGGAEVASGKQKANSFSDHRLTGRIYTYGEFPGGPVGIGLDKLNPIQTATVDKPWLDPKTEITVDAAPIAIYLASSQDYARFLPYIRGASKVGVSRQSLYSNDGIFVVRGQAIVAQLRGEGIDQTALNTLLNAFGADFIFKGPKSALHDTRGTTQNALVSWVGALLDKGQVLYILKRNKLYPVSRDFIKSNDEVAKFIDSQAKAIFLEKVEILAYH